jgi:flavin-dependent dehydrogenase
MVGSTEALEPAEYDAIIVGASLAGCTAAILLGRAGVRVALVEKQPDPRAFKRICSHFILSPSVPTIERLGLLDRIVEAGGVRSRWRAHTPWGWIEPPREQALKGVNLRRELLDPLMRDEAAATPGVDLMLGRSANRILRNDGVVAGVVVRDHQGTETPLRSRLTIGADGRDSAIADLAEVPTKTLPHGRFAYSAYYKGALPANAPDGTAWFLDPMWAVAFPTDGGLVFCGAMPTKDRLPEFKPDPEAAMLSLFDGLPEAPPIRDGQRVGPVLGKLDMSHRVRSPTGPGLALVGDAALTTDPLFGAGCCWAIQTGEWLADSVTPALHGAESLGRGLRRYRRRHRRELRSHSFAIHDYATGRRMRASEGLLMAAAARDAKLATTFDKFAMREIKPARMFVGTLPRTLALQARWALSGDTPRRQADVEASAVDAGHLTA